MDSDSPCKSQWYLCYFGFYLAALFYRPTHIIRDDTSTILEFNNRESLISTDDMTDRAIGISSFEIILHEHNSCPYLEYEGLWCETSLLECFDELLSSLAAHLEDEYIFADSIESVIVIGIDGDIASKKFRMILCLDSNIARGEELS